MAATIEVFAGIGAMIAHAAAAAGADPARLRAATGFDPALGSDPDARIPLELETALWDTAARLLNDDAFGLHAAERVRPGAFDVLDYAVRTAPDLRTSLQRLARYNRLVHDAAVFTLLDRGGALRAEHALRGGASQSRHATEFTLAAIVIIGAQIAAAPVRPRAVEFRHAAPASTAEHERIFGLRPAFGCDVNAIEIDPATLDRPAAVADPALSRLIERHAEALLAARPEPAESTAQRVRRLLAGTLREGAGSLADTARRLHMSERSLQRRLSAEDVTFDELLDGVRRDLSLRYLADPRIAIAEVAYLVGYSEPSAFHRAFKRWTGNTPAEAWHRAAQPSLWIA